MWTLLHATAAIYPDAPTEDQKRDMAYWLSVFSALVKYNSGGCRKCSAEWDKILAIMPPPLGSRRDFYPWTLAAHDRVNRAKNKPLMHPNLTLQHPLLVAS